LHLQRLAIATLVEAAAGHLKKALGERRIIVNAGEELPLVRADLELAKDIFWFQLADNANLYSKKNIHHHHCGRNGRLVTVSVADRGARGLTPLNRGLSSNKFYAAKTSGIRCAAQGWDADRKGYRDGAWRLHFGDQPANSGRCFVHLAVALRREDR